MWQDLIFLFFSYWPYSVELVWLWRIVPDYAVIKHVVAFIVEDAAIVEEKWNKGSVLTYLSNPVPDHVEGNHFVPDGDGVVGVQLLHNWLGSVLR